MKRLTQLVYAVLATGCASTTTSRLGLEPLQTVTQVDLKRYVGTWYEIAHFPHRFQRGCTATTATYSLRPDGGIDVVNRCRKGSPSGPEKVARGRARVVDPSTNAKLEVSFFRPFWGDYWILELGRDYDYAVVGHPSRDYLWILAREPQLDDQHYRQILERLEQQNYDTSKLVRTVHQANKAQPATKRDRLLSGAEGDASSSRSQEDQR